MQKQKCHEFAEKMGWVIVKEYSEKGVSGFKVSAKDRDAIIEIRKAAALKAFDVLLVFMFDRLGRKEDETPFVLEWFVNNGIEVWSTMEGQQRIETHSDKLIEANKLTEERMGERLEQLEAENGGEAAYISTEIARLQAERNGLMLERAEHSNRELQIRLLLELVDEMEAVAKRCRDLFGSAEDVQRDAKLSHLRGTAKLLRSVRQAVLITMSFSGAPTSTFRRACLT